MATALAFGILMTIADFHLGFIDRATEIDDGNYFGEGVMLIHGILPYRSYVDVQPPGVVLLMGPFAFLGRIFGDRLAFETARLFVVLVGMFNIALLGRIVRRRHWVGVLAALFSLGFYLDSVVATHTILLEPFLVFGTLLAFVIVFNDTETATFSPTRWFIAGTILGLTTSIKIWEVVPVFVLFVMASSRGRRCVVHFTVGVVAAASLVITPFISYAPGKFFREVVVVQATRSRLDQLGEKARLWNLLGAAVPAHFPRSGILWISVGFFIFVALACLAFFLAHRGVSRRAMTNLDLCAIACLVAVFVAYLSTGEYDSHYGGFFAPFFALVVSSLAIWFLPASRTIVKLSFVILLLAYFGLSDRSFFLTKYPNAPTVAIDKIYSPKACVISQTYSPLILANRYNLFRSNCPHALDIYGTELTDGNGFADFRSDAGALKLQADWLRWLHRANGLILFSRPSGNPNLGHLARAYIQEHFHLSDITDSFYLYKRD